MKVQIVNAGRKDVDDFFKLNDVFTVERLNHTPLVVFISTENAIQVRLLDYARDLLSFPDCHPLTGRGEQSSAMSLLALFHKKP